MKLYFLTAVGVFAVSKERASALLSRSRREIDNRADSEFENPYSSGQVGLPNNGSANPSDIMWKEFIAGIPSKAMAPF